MYCKFLKISFSLFLVPLLIYGQNDSSVFISKNTTTNIYGFVRGGFYGNTGKLNNKPFVSSAFSDFGLKVESGNGLNFKAFADMRLRYGSEFLEPVNRLELREAYIKIYGKQWDITAGQKIIKWGRADFTNPTSKFSPQDYISRSPDHDDKDLGNLLVSARWHPSSLITFEADAVPYYRSSVLIVKPVPLPAYVSIDQMESLVTDSKLFSYGFKADLHTSRIDMSLSWFDGYDPMPGIALTGLNIDTTGIYPIPYTKLAATPYKIRNIGFDFETTAGNLGLRGEAAYTFPYKSFKMYEYVPCSEIKWVAGADLTSGDWRFTWEYSGKFIPGFESPAVSPFIGTEMDMGQLALLLANPGFDFTGYVRQEVGAFNRLYNYQMNRMSHSAGMRIETDLLFGKLTPSLFTLYNFTTRDLLIMPELTCKPADGITIYAGWDFYSGRKGSVYDIIDDFMNCVRVALRVDF